MKLVSLSDGYIEFLRERCPNVMDNKYEERNHTRKYIGVVLTINEFNYFVPLSSPKNYDYLPNGTIRKSDLFCSRIVLNDGGGKMHLYGKIVYKSMIPVPDTVITDYVILDEEDEKYRDVVINEYHWISLHLGEIIDKSAKIYRYKYDPRFEKDPRREKVIDFKEAEKACKIYSTYVK